jgi:3'-phosphoadenosine 5'-phosphosulfate sulfotransferase (PAPS reductase)/FAD synthetase
MKRDIRELSQRQKWNLTQKIDHTLGVIEQFYNHCDGKVAVSFSGGKDSTVLLYLVRKIFPSVKGVFANTGLEYPEIVKFAKKQKNIEFVKPLKSYFQVVREYGWPLLSKNISRSIYRLQNNPTQKQIEAAFGDGGDRIPERFRWIIDSDIRLSDKCCYFMKEEPMDRFYRENNLSPIIGTMAAESKRRALAWASGGGCNILEGVNKKSKPLSIWMERDIWEFIKKEKLEISEAYKWYNRTGCMYCGYGINLDKFPNKFNMLAKTHPAFHDLIINKKGLGDILKRLKIHYSEAPPETLSLF